MRVREANTRILRAMLQPNMDAMLSNLSRPCAASTDPQTRGESNSMQGASVKQTRSVCSERARTPAGGRSRCGFAKQIRGFSAQSSNPIQMRCRWDDDRQYPAPTPPPYRGESNSAQGVLLSTEAASRNRPSERDVLSASRPVLLNSKTCALSISKLGRRRPKRNSRRSI